MAATTPAPPPSATKPTKSITKTVQKAVNALIKWRNDKLQTQNPDLLESDEFAYLVLTFKKIPPKGRVNAYKIPLPNPLYSQLSELCLIYDDGPKSDLTKDFIEKKIKAENIPVSKILKLSKLKSDYVPFESKRKLMYSYDMFLADKRIVPLLPKYLGKHFFKKKKIPVPVDLQHKNWKEQVDKICGSALLFLSTGTCSVVRVAKVSMSIDEIVENAVAAINGIVEIVPKNWGGVRSFHLKLFESLALPVYQAVPDVTLKIEGEKGVEEGEKEVKEVVKSESKDLKSEKKSNKKGRIHEVRYLDSNVGEVLDDDDFGIVGGVDIGEGKQSENDEPGSGELGKKKRKKEKVAGELKGEKRLKKSAKAKDDAELNGEKVIGEKKLKRSAKAGEEDGSTVIHKKDGISLKEKKKDVTKKKADDLSAQGEESIGKKEKRKSKESVGKKEKRKSEDEKLKSTEANLKKAKRSKKAAE